MHKNIKLVVICMLLNLHVFAQEQIGLRFDNFGSLSGMTINPAQNLTSPFSWSVHLGSAGVFVDTNYGYFRNTKLGALARNPESVVPVSETFDGPVASGSIILDYYDNNRQKHADLIATAMGPSLQINIDNIHVIGLFTRFRFASSARNIPAKGNYYEFDRVPFYDEIDLTPFRRVGMGWREIGINYARSFELDNGTIGIGISPKLLTGYESFYFDNLTDQKLTQLPGDTFAFNTATVNYGFTTSNETGEDISLSKNGRGLGLDIGATFTIDHPSEDDYLLKLGVSFLDLGKINFTENTERHRIETDTIDAFPAGKMKDLTTVDQLVGFLSLHTMGDSTASLQGGQYGIGLPSALSLQADYQVYPNVFVNALLVQRFPQGRNIAVARPNLLAVTPRYEHRWFSASLPISVYNWSDFRVGLAARAGYLVFGTDNLGSYFNQKRWTGTDFYVGLHFTPFNSNWDFGFLNFGGGGKGAKCYEF